jgi:hypothetical protein
MDLNVLSVVVRVLARLHEPRDERGLTTAELLGNAALGVLALVAIWGALRTLGLDIVDWVRDELLAS